MKTLAPFLLFILFTFMLMNYTKSENKASATAADSIARIWHGWTSRKNANAFEKVLITQAIPGIEKNKPSGYLGIQVLRRDLDNEVEFTTIMWFTSLSAVKEFAGEDYETAHIDPQVKPLLLRYDKKSLHSNVIHSTF
jgi:hypothetical protein